MRKEQPDSDKSDFQIEFNDGGKMSRRKTAFLPGGAYVFEDELRVKGVLNATIIICAAWLLELFELKSGEIFFICGGDEETMPVRPAAKVFGVLYPPFTITRPCFENAQGLLKGIASLEVLPENIPSAPLIFETIGSESLTSVAKAVEIINSGANYQSVEAYPKASLLSVKAKKLIDENYFVYPSIGRIAERLSVSQAHLSRQFKSDFGMNPSSYLRQLRMADAPLLLAKGEPIIDVSQDVGYNDLSRFYKQFRQTTNTSPGACQAMMKLSRT